MITQIKKRDRVRGEMLNPEAQYKEGLKKWTSFWRANPHRFLRDYIGCTYLKPFQDILLYEMVHNTDFVYTASRGQGKSEIVSWYACIMSMLYAGIEIVISSGKLLCHLIWKHIMKNWGVSVKAKLEIIC